MQSTRIKTITVPSVVSIRALEIMLKPRKIIHTVREGDTRTVTYKIPSGGST